LTMAKKKTKKRKNVNKIKGVPILDRHRSVLNEMLANIRKPKKERKTQEQILLEHGYSAGYAKMPSVLRNTNSFQALFDKEIPESLLVKTHKGLIKHSNWRARDAALDKAYKIGKRYGDVTVHHDFSDVSDRELEGELARTVSEILEIAAGTTATKESE
jgi:hypothetical protein